MKYINYPDEYNLHKDTAKNYKLVGI